MVAVVMTAVVMVAVVIRTNLTSLMLGGDICVVVSGGGVKHSVNKQ